MYSKNLTEDLRLRLSATDMDFLRNLSNQRSMSVSEVIRSIIGEYRRSLDTITILQEAINLTKQEQSQNKRVAAYGSKMKSKKGVKLSNGDTKTDINNKL